VKVQTKLLLFLFFISAFFICGLLSLQLFSSARTESLLTLKINEKNTLFDKIIKLESASLETFAYDFSVNKATLGIFEPGGAEAAKKDLLPFLQSFNVHAVWVYRADLTTVFHYNIFESPDFINLPVPRDRFLRALALRPFHSFFVNIPEGFLEISIAPVQPLEDYDRKSAPHGFLAAGRLWDQAYIDELSALTESTIRADLVVQGSPQPPVTDGRRGTISFSRPLLAWDKSILGQITVTGTNLLVSEFIKVTGRQMIITMVFSAAILLFLFFFALKYLRAPLRLISQSLATGDPAPLDGIKDAQTDFGTVARLMISFFRQQDELNREVA